MGPCRCRNKAKNPAVSAGIRLAEKTRQENPCICINVLHTSGGVPNKRRELRKLCRRVSSHRLQFPIITYWSCRRSLGGRARGLNGSRPNRASHVWACRTLPGACTAWRPSHSRRRTTRHSGGGWQECVPNAKHDKCALVADDRIIISETGTDVISDWYKRRKLPTVPNFGIRNSTISCYARGATKACANGKGTQATSGRMRLQ